MNAKTANSSTSMRVHWFEHVRKTRLKMTRKKKEPVSHREAMKSASETWGDVKQKIVRANVRAERKKAKESKIM